MNRLWGLMAAGLAVAAATVASPALAQSYPSKAIRLVSPFPPGGSVDVVGRLLAAKLSESMGQQMVVDNRSGASGVIGTEIVMNSPQGPRRPSQVKFYEERGLTVIASTPEEAAAHLEREQMKWGRVIKERGIKAH